MFNKTIRFFTFSILLLTFFCSASFCLAAFNLNVTPSEAGFDLRFGKIFPSDFKISKEITVRITSDIGKQYRVMQKVDKPLSTYDGSQIPDSQFKMYPLVNSNSKGTLLYREELPVNQFDTVLYTSDGLGTSDSFKIVYTLTPSQKQIPGSYYGRISYILLPVDSTQQQVVVFLNVYADLGGGGTPVAEVTTASGQRRLSLSSKGMNPKENLAFKENPQVSLKISSPMGSTYRIYQSLEGGALMSGSGDEFDLSKVLFSVTGGEKGTLAREGDLKPAVAKQLLYTSDPSGSADTFVITYKPTKDFRLQKANLYRGKLNFIIEKVNSQTGTPEILQSMDVELDIKPLFDIYVYSDGIEGVNLKFGDVSYKTGPKTSDVEIYVESNMGKSYQVIQKTAGPMADENGDKIPKEDFTVKVNDIANTEAEVPKFYLSESSPVKEGETVIFSSGPSGECAHFMIQYKLVMHQDTKSGNYSTRIGYSLALN